MSDPLLERLARENPVADIAPLPFSDIVARIEAGGAPAGASALTAERPSRRRRRRIPTPRLGRRELVSSVAAMIAAAAAVVAIVGHARSGASEPAVPASTRPPAANALAARFAVLRSGPGPAPPSRLAARIDGALHGRPAEVRRVISATGTVWIAVGTDGRLCVTLTVAGRTETLEISCASRARALRVGVRVAGELGTATRYVAGVVPDQVSHVAVHPERGARVLLAAHDNVYSAAFRSGRRTGSPAE